MVTSHNFGNDEVGKSLHHQESSFSMSFGYWCQVLFLVKHLLCFETTESALMYIGAMVCFEQLLGVL